MKVDKLLPVVLPLALIGAFVYHLNNQIEVRSTFQTNVEEARNYVQHEVLYDGMNHYEDAMNQESTLELSLEAGQVYLDRNMPDQAVEWYESKLLPVYYDQVQTYEYGMRAYQMADNLEGMFRLYDNYQDRGLSSEFVENAINDICYEFKLAGRYEQVRAFSTAGGAVVGTQEQKGMVNRSGNMILPMAYSEMSAYTSYVAVKKADGTACFIDSEGNVRITASLVASKDPDIGEITEFKAISDGLIAAGNGSLWNFYDSTTFEKRFGGFADVTLVSDGVGGVSNGTKWALISSSGTLITDYLFDEVLVDSNGFPCHGNAVLVREGETYYLLDKNGNRINDSLYDDAEAFSDSSYTAVEKDGKWIFVNQEGKESSLDGYEKVHAFSHGYAAVCKDGKWGYVNGSGDLVIDCQFEDAGPMSDKGSAFVQDETGYWSLLVLYLYQH